MNESVPEPSELRVSHVDADDVVELYCRVCDYDLRGLTSGRCPECGTPFDPESLVVPSATTGPLFWESGESQSRIGRTLRTFWGLAVHPLATCTQLGVVPRDFGRRQLWLLPWVALFPSLLAPISSTAWQLRTTMAIRSGTPTRVFGTVELLWHHQVFWWDQLAAILLHGVIVLMVYAFLSLVLSSDVDPYRELAASVLMLGLITVAALLIPSPLALLPPATLLAAIFAAMNLRADRADYGRAVRRTVRSALYIAPMVMLLILYIRLAYYAALVLLEAGWLPADILMQLESSRALAGSLLFAATAYLFLRRVLRGHSVRAAGVAVLYLVAYHACFDRLPDYVRAPVRATLFHFGLIEDL